MTGTNGPSPVEQPEPPELPWEVMDLCQLVVDRPEGYLLQQVADLTASALPGLLGVGVLLLEENAVRSAAFTSTAAAMLDERQHEPGFGPYAAAAQHGQTFRIDCTSPVTPPVPAPSPGDGRAGAEAYRDLLAVARRHGVGEVVVVGMPPPTRVFGTLLLCSGQRVDATTLARARALTTCIAGVLATAELYRSAARRADQLQTALATRPVIEQAKGVLAAQYGIDPEQAFAHLAQVSQSTNTKLRDLAARVVADALQERPTRPSPTPSR